MTRHCLYHGDARELGYLAAGSVHLVVTSPPYFNLKEYRRGVNQLGIIPDYDEFVRELDKVWRECFRVLVPGGRLVCVVGDVCLSRRKYGRHVVLPLHSDIAVSCRKLGFDNLNPILWHKISNAVFEANTRSSILGKPYEPNAIIKNDVEYILMERKPGGYRQPTALQREQSRIDRDDFNKWFTQIWELPGASTKNGHPAPFPLELALRLVKMFSFVGDTVLDPFCGSGTTMAAALQCGRNSIGVEAEAYYCEQISKRVQSLLPKFPGSDFTYQDLSHEIDAASHTVIADTETALAGVGAGTGACAGDAGVSVMYEPDMAALRTAVAGTVAETAATADVVVAANNGAGVGMEVSTGAGAAAVRDKAKTGGKRSGVSCNKTVSGAVHPNTIVAEHTRKLQATEDDAGDLPLLRYLA